MAHRVRSRRSTQIMLLAPFPIFMGLTALTAVEVVTGPPRQAPEGLLWCIASGLVFLGWTSFHTLRQRRGVRAIREPEQLLRLGSYAASAAGFEHVVDRYRAYGNLQAAAVNNLSVVAYQRGDATQALEMLRRIEASGWARSGTDLQLTVLQNRALYDAILGDLDDAARCLDLLRSRMTAARAAASLLMPDVFLAARRRNFAEVIALTGTTAAAPKLQMKSLRLIRAWALQEVSPDTSKDEIRMLIDGARPVTPGELHHVIVDWPELHAFMSTHGFEAAAARAS